MAHDVFISYASEDKPIADAVCAGLERDGIRCWIAPRDILASDNYDDAIIRAIDDARVMVVIFSSNIFQSQFVKSEIERGFSKGRIIAPFRIENVIPKGGLELYLGRRHWLDAMTPPLQTHIHTLAVTVRSMLTVGEEQPGAEAANPEIPSAPAVVPPASPAAGTTPPQTPRKSMRPAWLATGALAAIGVLAGICLIVAAFLVIKNLTGSPRQASFSPTQPAGIPTQARTTGMTTGIATAIPPSFIPPTPTPPDNLQTGGSNPPTAASPAITSGNWLPLGDLPRSVNAFVVDPSDSKIIYAATGDYTGAGGGVYRSDDSGLTWKNTSEGLPPQTVLSLGVVSGATPSLIAFFDNTHDTYASTDRGASWTRLATLPGGGGNPVLALIPVPGKRRILALVRSQGIVVSENNGQSWTPLGEGLPMDPTWGPLVQSLALDPTNPMILYAGTGGAGGGGQGVYKSSDGGQTWTPSNKGMLDYYITALAVDPLNPQVVYAGCNDGELFKSGDGGQTWTNLKDRLVLRQYGEPRQIRGIQIDPSDGAVYILGDNSGVMVGKNGGETWSLLGNPPGIDQPTYVAWAVVSGEKPVILLSVDNPSKQAWRYSAEPVALSPTAAPSPSGETPGISIKPSGAWQANADLPREVKALVVDPTNPELIFAGTPGGVYKSEDGGLTWKISSTGMKNSSVGALAYSAGNPPVLLAASDKSDEIYASADHGQTWSIKGKSGVTTFMGGSLYASPAAPNSIYLFSVDGSVRSEDGGQTWQPLGDGLPSDERHSLALTVAFDPTNPKVIYVGTGGFVGQGQGVFKSTDGGETWSPSNRGMLDYRIIALAVDPKNPQIIYAGGDSGDLFKSSDGGQTWTNLKDRLVLRQYGEPRGIRSLQVDPITGVVYLLGDNSGLIYSGDGGGKWRMVGNPPGTDQPSFQAMAISFGESPTFILSAQDQGGSWRFGSQP
jgi:photosystem II stability/assembly factor-like uncharacterized protein